MDAPNVLATGVVSLDEQRLINEELRAVELWWHPAWEKYL
jgi:hypothetical protein